MTKKDEQPVERKQEMKIKYKRKSVKRYKYGKQFLMDYQNILRSIEPKNVYGTIVMDAEHEIRTISRQGKLIGHII